MPDYKGIYSGPMTYRPRVETIEAMIVDESNLEEVANWCGGRVVANESGLHYPTLAGNAFIQIGDFLVKFPNGRFETRSSMQMDSDYEQDLPPKFLPRNNYTPYDQRVQHSYGYARSKE